MTGYIVPSTELHILRRGKTLHDVGTVAGPLPPNEVYLLLKPGDALILSGNKIPGKNGLPPAPATIPITLPGVFADVKTGERICFDDGKIIGIIESVSKDALQVRITGAKPQGSKLRADKGINLPDSDLSVSGLTEKDLIDLAFITRHADLVALSFVSDPSDIIALQRELAQRGCSNLGMVLKIETRQALKRLPSLLLTAMASHPIGVMIARGDLATLAGIWVKTRTDFGQGERRRPCSCYPGCDEKPDARPCGHQRARSRQV